jgi:Family of unknown function (DUF6064)
MSEWWTYTLSDFLLFSSRTYYRLFEIYNAAIWPAQIAAIGLGLAILVLLRRAAGTRGRWIAAILAGCWLWVAIAFHADRYATINWAAVYFAWAFGLEAAVLIWIGILRGRLTFERPAGTAGRAGLWIFLFALAVEPCVGPLLGRGWKQVEVFGVAPDPTAVATLGLLLLAEGRGRGWLMVIPALWCAISGATLLAMKTPDAWIPPVAAAVAIAVALIRRSARSGGSGFATDARLGRMRPRPRV